MTIIIIIEELAGLNSGTKHGPETMYSYSYSHSPPPPLPLFVLAIIIHSIHMIVTIVSRRFEEGGVGKWKEVMELAIYQSIHRWMDKWMNGWKIAKNIIILRKASRSSSKSRRTNRESSRKRRGIRQTDRNIPLDSCRKSQNTIIVFLPVFSDSRILEVLENFHQVQEFGLEKLN